MKIPLTYANNRIFVKAVISSIKAHIRLASIYFIIDTGSPETFITEAEAIRINIPLNKFSFDKHTRMGGTNYELKVLKKQVKLYLKNEEEKTTVLELPSIKVSKCTKSNLKEKGIASNFPSIIGLDFLEQNNLTLHCDLKNNNCYLELKEE